MTVLVDRRAFFAGTAAAAGSLAAPALGQGKWPDRPIKVVVPYAAGGGTDIVARPWMEFLGAALGQPCIIENRGGAAGMIGAEAAAKSAPDGYTLLFTPNNPLDILPHLKKVPYDPEKSFEPVGLAGFMVTGFAIHPAPGPRSFQEMVAFAKKNPGKLAFGSSGIGSGTHMRVEMLKRKADVDILHVPYRGGADAITDLLAGNAHMMNESGTHPHVKAGKLQMLNINHARRSPLFPAVPTLRELGLEGADCPIWFSLWAPAGTSKEIAGRINAAMADVGRNEALKARLVDAGYEAETRTPDQLMAFLREDSRINADLIKAANIKYE